MGTDRGVPFAKQAFDRLCTLELLLEEPLQVYVYNGVQRSIPTERHTTCYLEDTPGILDILLAGQSTPPRSLIQITLLTQAIY